MEKKLKKSDFIKNSQDPNLNHNVIKMMNKSWNDIVNNPDIISAENFTTKQLHTLASLNIEQFAQTGLYISGEHKRYDEPVRHVASFVIGDVRNELKSMIRQQLVVN